VDEDFFETYGYPPCYENGRMYDMPEITIEQVYREIQQLKTVLLGVPGTDDMGLYGQVKDMVKLQKEINGTVRSTATWCKALKWVVGLLALALIGSVTAGQLGLW